jgi:pilus assembly protein CpaE
MSELILVSPSDEFDGRVAEALRPTSSTSRRIWRDDLLNTPVAALVGEVTRGNPAVVALGPDLDLDDVLPLANALERERPDVVVVIVAKPSINVLERALRAGARGVIAPSAPTAEVALALHDAFDASSHRRAFVAPAVEEHPRHVICVVSPKGGVGKTTVSTNLAIGLAKAAPGEVVIVDLDFQFGDVASSLRMTPEHTFSDVVRTIGPLDALTLKVYLTASTDGLYALCAPEEPAEADLIDTDHVKQVISLLASEFRYVVIDTGSGLDDGTLAALELCTDIVVLTSTEVPSVRATRKELASLDLIGVTDPERHFVVNRANAQVGLPVSEVEASVGIPVAVAIPSSREVPVSVNQGEPVLAVDRRTAVRDALQQLVARFVPNAEPETTRAWSWRKTKEARS